MLCEIFCAVIRPVGTFPAPKPPFFRGCHLWWQPRKKKLPPPLRGKGSGAGAKQKTEVRGEKTEAAGNYVFLHREERDKSTVRSCFRAPMRGYLKERRLRAGLQSSKARMGAFPIHRTYSSPSLERELWGGEDFAKYLLKIKNTSFLTDPIWGTNQASFCSSLLPSRLTGENP